MSKNEELEKRYDEVLKELTDEFNTSKSGFLLIVSNGDGFGHAAFGGYSKVVYDGLRMNMIQNELFKKTVYLACKTVMNELNEEFKL